MPAVPFTPYNGDADFQQASALSRPAAIVTFDGGVPGIIFDPFLSQGADFSGLFNLQPACFPCIQWPCQNSATGGALSTVYSINFAQDSAAAAIQIVTNQGATSFKLLLDGNVVESFTVTTNSNTAADDFYGFTGIKFNVLQFQISATHSFFNLDDVQYVVAEYVPEPSAIALSGVGLAGLAAFGKSSKRSRFA